MGKNWNMNSRLLKTMGNLSFSAIFCFITYIDVTKKKKVSSRIKDQKKLPEDLLSGSFWFQPRIKLSLHP